MVAVEEEEVGVHEEGVGQPSRRLSRYVRGSRVETAMR